MESKELVNTNSCLDVYTVTLESKSSSSSLRTSARHPRLAGIWGVAHQRRRQAFRGGAPSQAACASLDRRKTRSIPPYRRKRRRSCQAGRRRGALCQDERKRSEAMPDGRKGGAPHNSPAEGGDRAAWLTGPSTEGEVPMATMGEEEGGAGRCARQLWRSNF
jgi:hypothetical protein